jgi:Ca2+-binding EF-hand superfamily protein
MKIETRFKQLRRAFRLIDLDKSGSCDRAEVRQMLQHLFNCQVDHGPMELLLDLLDFDGSGHIELREFARFFTNDGERIDLRERLAQMHKARARQAQACAPPHRAPLRRPASAR